MEKNTQNLDKIMSQNKEGENLTFNQKWHLGIKEEQKYVLNVGFFEMICDMYLPHKLTFDVSNEIYDICTCPAKLEDLMDLIKKKVGETAGLPMTQDRLYSSSEIMTAKKVNERFEKIKEPSEKGFYYMAIDLGDNGSTHLHLQGSVNPFTINNVSVDEGTKIKFSDGDFYKAFKDAVYVNKDGSKLPYKSLDVTICV